MNTLKLQKEVNNVTIKISTSAKGTTLLDSVMSEFIFIATLPSKKREKDEEKEEEIIKESGPKSLNLKMTSTPTEITLDISFIMNYGDVGGMTIIVASGNIGVWNSGVGRLPGSTTDHPRDALVHCEHLAQGKKEKEKRKNLHIFAKHF